MFKAIGITIALVILGVLAYAATKPDDFRIERKTMIKASPETIFPLINDLRRSAEWSPWEKLDPEMKRTYSGPASGKGAAYAWEGNSEVGTGSMEIVEVDAPNKIVTRLDFLKPFEAHNIAEFTLRPTLDGTEVTWAMYGPQPYIGKVMGIVMNCQKMVGEKFEEGLTNLKAIAEK